MLPLVMAVIVFAVLVLVLVPLMRDGAAAPDSSRFDQAVYRDQLRELDRDIARGVLTDAEAASARLEIQRRLLATTTRKAAAPARLGKSPAMALIVTLIVVGGSIGLYMTLGAPELPDMPMVERLPNAAPKSGSNDVAEATARLRQRLDAEPANALGWLEYARIKADMDDWDAAADAYERAIALGQNAPSVMAGFGEMLVLRAQGTVVPAARDAFAAALARDPRNEAARYYTALAVGQDGDAAKAIDLLQGLLADLPGDSGMRADIGRRIAEAAKAAGLPVPPLAEGRGPDPAAVANAAQMTDNERQAMIQGMVTGLADRLERNPDDLDGWLRLGRAYAVMGDLDKAYRAYDRAMAMKPNDSAVMLQAAEGLLSHLGPTDEIPPRTVTLLHRIEDIAPGQVAVLWYLGLSAAHDGKGKDALEYWTRLLTKLPADGEEAKTVKQAMSAIKIR